MPATSSVRFRLDPPSDGPANMQRDIELLEIAELGAGCCRLYSWTCPWITLGKFQDAKKDLIPSSVPWIIRPTGGKAVLHGHDLTVGYAAPLQALISESMPVEKLERSIKMVYRAMASPIILAMRACGVPVALGEDTRFTGKGPRVADCFAHVSANDIVDERTGQKVCGCALKVTQNAALVQASIPVTKPLIDPAAVIVGGKLFASSQWDHERFAEELEGHLTLR